MVQILHQKFEQNNRNFKDLILLLTNFKKTAFNGNLIVKVQDLPSWKLGLARGRFTTISGGIDAEDRWQRNLAVACLNLPLDRFVKSQNESEIFLNANTLAQQYALGEVLFDIIQFSQQNHGVLAYSSIPMATDPTADGSIAALEIEPILTAAIRSWQEWVSVGLAAYAPSLVPSLPIKEQFLQSLDRATVAAEIASFDGRRSLRSIAVYHQQHLIDFTKPLLPFLLLGEISLSLPENSKLVRAAPAEPSNIVTADLNRIETNKAPLIACIDDSIYICKSLEKILVPKGYRVLGIQNALKIIPELITTKPDFIFLDLLMPVTNGYEVCRQIRKTPSLKNTPVVILTSKDGAIDRIHAKFVGADGFINKPIDTAEIFKILGRYLGKATTRS